MARAKKCAGCGTRPVKGPRARFCDDVECERKRARERRRKADQAARDRAAAERGNEPAEVDDGARPAGGVYSSTLHALTEAQRMHTPAGQQALALADRIDRGASDTGSSLAALGKQHLAALAEATRDLAEVGDPLDELRARRLTRAG